MAVKAKQHREELLYKFKLACEDLEEVVEPPGGKAPNVRNVTKGMHLLEQSYEECIKAQSVVTSIEKTSADEDTNWNWVKVHLRNPFKEVMEEYSAAYMRVFLYTSVKQHLKVGFW